KDNNLEEQISFRESAYGGTLKCEIDAKTSFTNNLAVPSGYQYYSQPLPPKDSERVEPHPELLEYEVPALKKIGVVPFKDQGEIPGFTEFIPEFIMKSLGNDVEIIILELSTDEEAGIYLFDTAVRLGEKFGVDGILQGRLRKLEVFGADHEQHYARDVRMNCEIESSLVDTIRGKYLWKNVAKVKNYTNAAEYNSSQKSLLRELIRKGIENLCEDIKKKKALDGGTQR
ncbi:hypothetical protein KKB99_03285, partial [bacterium]|nr:hypothetical protein [bacterium]MBU1025014.1 hypothetical protein [bacterium]